MRKKYDANFKARVVMEAMRNDKTLAELSQKFSLHKVQIIKWRKQGIENFSTLFSEKNKGVLKEKEGLIEELYKQIGMLKTENDWLKKKSEFFS